MIIYIELELFVSIISMLKYAGIVTGNWPWHWATICFIILRHYASSLILRADSDACDWIESFVALIFINRFTIRTQESLDLLVAGLDFPIPVEIQRHPI